MNNTSARIGAAVMALVLAVTVAGCGKGGSNAEPARTTPAQVMPSAAGRQSSGIFVNDLVSGESTASTVSSAGIYAVRHGFIIPTIPQLPSESG